jgi:heme exporter protein C
MTSTKTKLAYWSVTLALFAIAFTMLFAYTPVEQTMGPIQKIFYGHLPAAICTFFACMTCFIASIGYLGQRKVWLDDLAAASAKVAVFLCTIVLATGMIWGHSAWGQWWTWSPRLTFSLVLWLLYVVYLMIRMSVESTQRRALISAVYGVIAFLDVPLVWLSVRLMPDIHPQSVQLDPRMKITLAFWFIPVVLMTIGLILQGYQWNRRQSEARLVGEPASAGVSGAAPAPMRWIGGSL